jgi:Flp pilus assembly protein TadG
MVLARPAFLLTNMRSIKHHKSEYDARRAGTAATELAIILPVLMLLALGGADFGRIALYSEVVSNAARVGAEVGGTRRFTIDTRAAWEGKIQQAITEEMQNAPNFDAGRLESNVSTVTDSDGIVRVNVDVWYPFQTVVNWPLLPHEVKLHEHVHYRQFR